MYVFSPELGLFLLMHAFVHLYMYAKLVFFYMLLCIFLSYTSMTSVKWILLKLYASRWKNVVKWSGNHKAKT